MQTILCQPYTSSEEEYLKDVKIMVIPEVDNKVVGVSLVVKDLQQASRSTTTIIQFIKHLHELHDINTKPTIQEIS